ncbi:MAG: type I-U CRISPR-associated helicase/endonuclease Cas3 [Rhodospirillaceae bacterium]|nr:type I-U CRISPR-associated helicase/endonuclease Cas3 [Rhodospirillaceae bacterium]
MFPDFARFFELCHDVEPYRWQRRLSDQVLADRRWPSALDLPTGSGKTSAIDIGLYALAMAANRGDFGTFPRRIVLIADRRVLVDQAWRRGERLLERIESRPELAPVRRALARLSPEERPSSIRLRGACPTDPRWCRSPDQVQIIASTVDQIGSRLLMRGYGVSPRMRSVEAGLVGQDTLFLLDEVHLAGPFLDTLTHLERLDPIRDIAPRRQVVPMSATLVPTAATVHPFQLTQAENRDTALAPRLNASKLVRWSDQNVERTLAGIDVPCVLMVANTVRTALEWFKKAANAKTVRLHGKALKREAFLVTGRMRQLDRQRTLEAVERRLKRRDPTLVVATQCIEAGVDWDFDAMISECASWDALVQRMGRVNRRGERHDAECFILQARRTLTRTGAVEKSCPVYREHEIGTASWLADASPIRCTPGSMPEAPEGCVLPPTSAPVLIPEYLDLWSQNRADGPAFDVSVFLHGVQEERGVQVVWRDLDLVRDRLQLERLFKALPPSSLEAVSVPIRELRRWLGDRPSIRLGTEVHIQSAGDIGVGATVVVPTEYGGIGGHGTFDGSADCVSDVSSAAMRDHRDMKFQFHDAPPVHDDETIDEQVKTWIAEDESRSILNEWTWIDVGRRWLFLSEVPIEDDDDGPTFRRRAVRLESHLNGVEARTRAVAGRLGLSAAMAEDLAMAARLHDLGKLDDRFQQLCGRTSGTGPLGKSGQNWVARRRREAISVYPKGERHEALSVELMIRNGLHETANDMELVEHIVASHHGWARPFIRTAQGKAPIRDRLFGLDFEAELTHKEAMRAPARFRSVQRKFGWLGLSWLEAIVQLCDHRQSEAEERGEIAPAGGTPFDCRQAVSSRSVPATEIALTALNGMIPGDFLAAVGVLRALHLGDEPAFLRWQGTQPHYTTNLGIDEIVALIVDVRKGFGGDWPAELNKLSCEQCEELLLNAEEPFRSLVVAMISTGGRSDMDFVSGGRGGFRDVFNWSTSPQKRGFASDDLLRALTGPRTLRNGGKSFRWSPLAAQGANRPRSATNDKRTEPWIEWLALMGVSALVSVPEERWGRLATRSTAVYGHGLNSKQFRWPLWRVALAWPDVCAALAGNRFSLHDALWCEAPRLIFGKSPNLSFGLGAGSPVWM